MSSWAATSILHAYEALSWNRLFASYILAELSFYACYRWVLIPRAQVRTLPKPYRDYGDDKTKLLERILNRLERQREHSYKHIDSHQLVSNFILGWFRAKPNIRISTITDANSDTPSFKKRSHAFLPGLQASSLLSSAETSDEDDVCSDDRKTIAGLKKTDVDQFFAWAFFGKELEDLDISDHLELQKLHQTLVEKSNIKFEPGTGGLFEGRRLTLEDVQSLHRPFLVYALVHFLERIGNCLLRFNGFRCYSTQTGLVYWHRSGFNAIRCPLLFFHGIVPGGKTLYLPFCLWGIGDKDRSMYVFENKAIGNSITFAALSEDETVAGVEEALIRHGDHKRHLALCGHSFGSCPLTWLLYSSIRDRIHQFILMDPVTILLSEPTVMYNFLYSRHEATDKFDKIQLVAGSELFTEHYLRRNFSWYNSELWLDSIPDSTRVLVFLSEKDTILSAPRVKGEIESHSMPNLDLVYWKGAEHADCIARPALWREVRQSMLAQENR